MSSDKDAEEVRVGFIGCGGIAQGHLRALHGHPHARVAAVCDVNPEAAERAAERFQAEPYTDYRAMLQRDDLNAAYLCVPPFAHGEMDLAVIERGLPFLVQKPVALDRATAREIAAAVKARGLITCVGYQLRYSGSTDAAREALAGHTIGLANGYYWCGSGRSSGHWLVQRAKSGGQVVEQATHTLDMLRYLVGEVRTVYALQAQRVLKEIDCPDVNALALGFENGAVGTFTATWMLHSSDWSLANVCDITFDESRLHWTPGGLTTTRGGETREENRPDASIDAAFVEAVRTGDRSLILSDYEDAVRTLALTLAADESARTGGPVEVASFAAG
jgi:myo-inositol 2-dehydrogenase / D-chiro-inositol 1-dehydrogenase